jgi:hypothetical protein
MAWILSMAWMAALQGAASAPPTASDFFRLPLISQQVISPDGGGSP